MDTGCHLPVRAARDALTAFTREATREATKHGQEVRTR